MGKKHLISDLEKGFRNFNLSILQIREIYDKIWCHIKTLNPGQTVASEIVGDMARNLAHGIRNPLGGIANFVTLLSDGMNSNQSENIKQILEGIQRIDKIVENLILFSKPVVPQLVKCNVVDILKVAVDSVKKKYIQENDPCLFSFELPKDEIYIFVDPGLIKQALQNILQNSVEAMSNGGNVKISVTENNKMKNLIICIKDEGNGLVNVDEKRLFHPFYTTKVNGMGLGLPTARMIIEKHNGKILLFNNRLKKGVLVVIFLPVSRR